MSVCHACAQRTALLANPLELMQAAEYQPCDCTAYSDDAWPDAAPRPEEVRPGVFST
ncbi:MAG: hypothetical protein ACRDPT_00795 [Streptomycetales bacterium]